MGGITTQIESDNFVDLINRTKDWANACERQGLYLDSCSLLIKHKGKYMLVGSNGIEVAVSEKYSKIPDKNLVLMLHAHS